MRKEDNGIFGEEKSSVSIRELVSNYLAYWPVFLISVIVCVAVGVAYTRYTVPKYMASTSFLIVGGSDGGKEDLVQEAISGKKEINLNNELLMLASDNLMQRTVAKNGFNTVYYKKGKILDVEIYKAAPFTLTAQQITDSNSVYTIYIKSINNSGGVFLYGPKDAEKQYSFAWNVPFTVSDQIFVLSPKAPIQKGDGEYIVRWEPIGYTAAVLSANYGVKAVDPKTNAIIMTVKTENLKKGTDVLDAIFTEFNQSDIEDRNKLSRTTVQFIDDRLVNITGELKGVEGNLENYQGSNDLVDIKSQSAQSMANSNSVSRNIQELGIQQNVAAMILDYFANPANSGKLVPSSLGLNDATLASLITQYNEMQLKKEREAPLVAPNSTVMQDLNTQLSNLRGSILESLNNISKNLRLQEKSLQQQNSQYKNLLSSVPHNERVMQEIKRKQTITEGLYLYLFQKREEAAISSTASSVAHYKQLDRAKSYGQVEPNSGNIIIYSGLLGLFLAFSGIYIKDLLNDKISSREDVTKRTSIPLLGQISHVPKRKMQAIAVLDRTVVGEQFRAIRTNLSFLLREKNKKTILITSSVSGEGKSFISLNLAAVFAMPGKKVALLEFDIRKPVISESLQINNSKGLTDFLTGDVRNIFDIMHVSSVIPQLHIYPSGPVPTNPADLLLTENMRKLFETLEAAYDYVVIDSPPANLVSDAFILAEYSDSVVYVLRNGKTTKKQLEFVNEVVENKTLKNVSLILNDIKNGSSYGYGDDYNYADPSTSKKKKLISAGYTVNS